MAPLSDPRLVVAGDDRRTRRRRPTTVATWPARPSPPSWGGTLRTLGIPQDAPGPRGRQQFRQGAAMSEVARLLAQLADLGRRPHRSGRRQPPGPSRRRFSGLSRRPGRTVDAISAMPCSAVPWQSSGSPAAISPQSDALAVPQVIADNLRELAGPLAHVVCGRPTEHLSLVAVTGTQRQDHGQPMDRPSPSRALRHHRHPRRRFPWGPGGHRLYHAGSHHPDARPGRVRGPGRQSLRPGSQLHRHRGRGA